ncbi:MAG: hypothetical protein JNK26_00745 [Candidatus Doudnabacteria bacterium]|nr:hypothetical protein [Candidatus Doudnabacteria bacterium]
MDNLRSRIITISRGFIFGATLILGAFLSVEQLDDGNVNNFLELCLIMVGVLFIEIFTSNQLRTKPLIEPSSKQDVFLHHILLPSTTYLSILGFTYFNRQTEIRLIVMSLGLFMFTVLFINIRAHYLSNMVLYTNTNYIYDVLKLLLFFLASNTVFHLVASFGGFLFLIFPLVVFGLTLLFVVRYEKLDWFGMRYIFALPVIITLVALSGLITGITPIQNTLVTFLSFYLGLAILHHILHRDMNKTLLLEYLVIFAIALVTVYSMNA